MSAEPQGEPDCSWLARALENSSAAVYGLITVAAELAVESPSRETIAKPMGAALITMVIYWLVPRLRVVARIAPADRGTPARARAAERHVR